MLSLNINPESLLRVPGDVWVFWKDTNGKYLGCNNQMSTSLRLQSNNAIIGLNDFDLGVSKNEADFYRQCDKQVMRTQISKQFYDTATVEKKKRFCLVLKSPLILENRKTIGIVGISYNLTQSSQILIDDSLKKLHDKYKLSSRELDCIYYLIRGKSAREIAEKLNLSTRTIESHIINIKDKINVTSKSELIEKIVDCLI